MSPIEGKVALNSLRRRNSFHMQNQGSENIPKITLNEIQAPVKEMQDIKSPKVDEIGIGVIKAGVSHSWRWLEGFYIHALVQKRSSKQNNDLIIKILEIWELVFLIFYSMCINYSYHNLKLTIIYEF